MFTVEDAFLKFKSRLELRPNESADVIRRHNEVREVIRAKFSVDRDFLTGSYARHTKTKPLQDVDVFCVLNKEKEGHYLDEPSSKLVEDFRKVLADHYGKENVCSDERCVTVRFGTPTGGEEEEEKVFSIDVVPAFDAGRAYKIPDSGSTEDWLKTDPEIHAEEATAANKAFNEQWKPVVKMIKKWNRNHGRPVPTSFLLEVMALDILYPPFSSGYARELKSFFATAAGRIYETWEDPAGVGPAVSHGLTDVQRATASAKMIETGKAIDQAILLKKQGKEGEALRVWRERVFGPMFPLS